MKRPKIDYHADLKSLYQAVRYGNFREVAPIRKAAIPDAVVKTLAQGKDG